MTLEKIEEEIEGEFRKRLMWSKEAELNLSSEFGVEPEKIIFHELTDEDWKKTNWNPVTPEMVYTNLGNALEAIEEARKEFPSIFEEGKFSSDWERAQANQKWFEKWFGIASAKP